MDKVRIFQNGRSQAVRLPKLYSLPGQEAIVRNFGAGVILLPLDRSWDMLEAALNEFEAGFKMNREQPAEQEWVPIRKLRVFCSAPTSALHDQRSSNSSPGEVS
jgi:antitoxin VapB